MIIRDLAGGSPAQGGGATGQRKHARVVRGDTAAALLFVAPALIALVVLRLVPAFSAFIDSLHKTNIFTMRQTFVGAQNYIELLHNPEFINTVKVTLLFALLVNPFQIAVAVILAVLFTRQFPLRGLLRSFIIFPIAVPPAVSAVVWSAIYRPDGLANATLKSLGLPAQPWITSSQQSLVSIILVVSWIGCGYWMLFLIAGINDIPDDVFEAARLDGAGFLRQTFSITMPLLRRPLGFVLVADTVSNFLVFAPVAILTNGGPEGSTSLLMFDIFTRAYSYGDVGKAAAAVFVLILLMLVAVLGQFALLRGED